MNRFKFLLSAVWILTVAEPSWIHAQKYTEDRVEESKTEEQELQRRRTDFDGNETDRDPEKDAQSGFIRLLNFSGNASEQVAIVLKDKIGQLKVLKYAFGSGRHTSYRELRPGEYTIGAYAPIEPQINREGTGIIPVQESDLIPRSNLKLEIELEPATCLTVAILPSTDGRLKLDVFEDIEVAGAPVLRTLNFLEDFAISGSIASQPNPQLFAPSIPVGLKTFSLSSAGPTLFNFLLKPSDESNPPRSLSTEMDLSLYPAQTVVFHYDRYGRETISTFRDGLGAALIDQ